MANILTSCLSVVNYNGSFHRSEEHWNVFTYTRNKEGRSL